MENKENKKPKGLIVLVVVLSILLCLSVGYICYDKFYTGNSDTTNTENNNSNNNENKQEDIILTEDEVKKLHDNLLVGDYGLYFDKKMDINTVDKNYIISYAIMKYVSENNIELGYGFFHECGNGNVQFCNTENHTVSKESVVFVSKTAVDNEVKNMFNINSINVKNRSKFEVPNSFANFVYFNEDNGFYFIDAIPGDGYITNYGDKMINYGQYGDELHIYSNHFGCNWYGGGYCVLSRNDSESKQDDVVVAVDKELLEDETVIGDKKIKTSDGFDFDYIFEKYGDKMDKYKTVFKKASDGKYYWFSSELVR